MQRTFIPLSLLAFVLAPLSLGQSNYPYFINTVAGSYPLGDGGPATAALLESPRGVAVDSSGNLYIGDNGNSLLRKVAAGSGVINTVPGGTGILPYDLKVDAAGNFYFVDGVSQVFRLTPAGNLSVVAGTAAQGYGGDEASASSALLRNPYALALDGAGNIYIADGGNNRIRKITRDGIIHTIAGTGTLGYSGDNGPAVSARLNGPRGIAVDGAGNLYIADYANHRIRKVTPDGIITTLAGTGAISSTGDGGLALQATLQYPAGLTVDAAGSLYVSSSGRVRKISPGGAIQAIAGNGVLTYGGDGGLATGARLDPASLATDSTGGLYITDYTNCRIRRVTPDGMIHTVAGASHFSGDGGPATSAVLHFPYATAFDRAGNMYISDSSNNRIRKVDISGVMSTYAGTGDSSTTAGSGIATQVGISTPRGLATDAGGNVYIADYGNCRVRRVSLEGSMTTVAGSGNCADSGDGGPAASAALRPYGVVVDGAGSLYVSDTIRHRVRKVSSDGTISTFAGTGSSGSATDGVPANQSALSSPYGLAIDKSGNLLIADSGNNRVRMVDRSGIISTIAGNGTAGTGNDGKPAASVGILSPTDIAVDDQGNLYITQPNYSYIRKVDSSGIISTIAGNNQWTYSGDSGPARSASMNWVRGIAVDAARDVYLADSTNHRIRKLTMNSPVRLDAIGGNGQSAPVGKYVPKPLAVQLVGRAAGVPGSKVIFSATAGTATLYPATTITDSSGRATSNVALGNAAGAVTISAAAAGMPPAVFTLTALDPNAAPSGGPHISAGGIVGAGASVPSVKEISANGIVTIYGDSFAPAGTARVVGSADLVSGHLPTRFAGICVEVGTARAPILAVYPNQINIQVPYNPLSKDAFVEVIKNCDAAGEVRGNMQSAMVRYATPEFFYFAAAANGKNPIAAVDAVKGGLIGAPGLLPGVAFRPAKPGDVLALYGTGFGATTPPVNAGELPTAVARAVLPAKVTIGNVTLASTDILYAGVAPFNAGLYQLNIRVPANVADGDQPVTLQLGLYSTPVGGFLTVKR